MLRSNQKNDVEVLMSKLHDATTDRWIHLKMMRRADTITTQVSWTVSNGGEFVQLTAMWKHAIETEVPPKSWKLRLESCGFAQTQSSRNVNQVVAHLAAMLGDLE